jgi:hypothetical protein
MVRMLHQGASIDLMDDPTRVDVGSKAQIYKTIAKWPRLASVLMVSCISGIIRHLRSSGRNGAGAVSGTPDSSGPRRRGVGKAGSARPATP